MGSAGKPRRRAAGLLGMLVLVALIEVVVGTRRGLVDPVAVQWRYRAKAVRARAKGADVLCLGDSLVRFGVDAPTLGKCLARRVENQAVLAAPAAATYFALRDALDAGARPGWVVVDFAPFLLLPGYRLNRAFLPETSGLRACVEIAWAARDPELGGALALAWLVPSAHARAGLRGVVARLARAGRDPSPLRRSRRPDLWLPGNDDGVFDWFYNADWHPGAEHRAYLERFLALAEREGIAVAWLIPPVGPTVSREWDASGLSRRYERFVGAIRAEHPTLIVLDAQRLEASPDQWLDPLHLNPRGAEALTRRVAEGLRAVESGRVGGWVDLGPGPLDGGEALPLTAVCAHTHRLGPIKFGGVNARIRNNSAASPNLLPAP